MDHSPDQSMDQKEQLSVIQTNKDVDGNFYHHLFVQAGGIFDAIEQKMPWMVGQTVVIQQDGAKTHTGEGTIRD